MDEVLEKIIIIISNLDKLEAMLEDNPNEQSETDKAISDLYHLIETTDFTPSQANKTLKELKSRLYDRRTIKQKKELVKEFFTNIKKLENHNNRQLLMSAINKRHGELQKEYKNRVYSSEDISELVGDSNV